LWCKVSSLIAAVTLALKEMHFPAARDEILTHVDERVVEGWEVRKFLDRSLTERSYSSLHEVLRDVTDWIEKQG